MKSYVAHEDIEQWKPLVEWLERPRGGCAHPAPPPVTVDATTTS
jgi:hypothetical protein